jgi:RNA polymerase sigma factor (sigma-70 family)
MEIRDLIDGAIAREPMPWGALVERYGPLVWRVLRKFRGLERETQEDLFQDVFAVLLDGGLESFQGSTEHEFRWYLKTITENEAKSCLRKHGRRMEEPFAIGDDGRDFADSSPGPEALAGGRETGIKLGACIRQIPLIDQEIFWMRERGLDYKRITQALGLPQGTVASKYHRAKEAIAECLKRSGIAV